MVVVVADDGFGVALDAEVAGFVVATGMTGDSLVWLVFVGGLGALGKLVVVVVIAEVAVGF